MILDVAAGAGVAVILVDKVRLDELHACDNILLG
jgi:hypothetical protein